MKGPETVSYICLTEEIKVSPRIIIFSSIPAREEFSFIVRTQPLATLELALEEIAV